MRKSKLVKAIIKYILDGENRKEVVRALKRYRNDFTTEIDYNYYNYGNILPYYSQIREFYEKNGVRANKDDILMCNNFRLNVGRAIDAILEEEE